MSTEVPLSSNWMKLQSKSKTNTNTKNGKITKDKKKTRVKTIHKDLIDKKTIPSSSSSSTAIRITPGTGEANDDNAIEFEQPALPQRTLLALKLEQGNLSNRKLEPGKFLAIDCEFVGVGPEGAESALARVSIVNFYGNLILDKYVKPKEKVTDWRTWVSGISPKHMKDAISFKEAQQLCSDLFQNRILVGHLIHHDLEALLLSHPIYLIRDTSKHLPFRKISNGKTPGLKKLTKEFLQIDIQSGEHSSVEDARATMLLYRMHKKEFEIIHRQKFGNNHNHNHKHHSGDDGQDNSGTSTKK